MRLETVEFVKIVVQKFCKILAPLIIKQNIFSDLIQLFILYPNVTLLH